MCIGRVVSRCPMPVLLALVLSVIVGLLHLPEEDAPDEGARRRVPATTAAW
jgi:hypothetical protein